MNLAGVLEITGDDPEFLAEFIQEFLGSTASQIDRLKSALSQEDAATAKREAHSIKGSAVAFGAEPLREIAFRVKRLASEEALDMASDALADLGQEWTQVVQELQRVLTKGMPQSGG